MGLNEVRCSGCQKNYLLTDWKYLSDDDGFLFAELFAASIRDQRKQPQNRSLESKSSSLRVNDARNPSKKFLAANAGLFLAIALLGLLPFFSVGALGISGSLNAFVGNVEGEARFWFTYIPLGWVAVAVSIIGLGVAAVAALRPSQAMKRTEKQLLAGLGVVVCLLLFASWFFVNKQLNDAVDSANSQLSPQDNPFAGLGGAFLRSVVSISPAIGLWLMLVVSLGIVGVNIYSLREGKESPEPGRVDSNPSLASGIRELSDLRDQGIISDEEFTVAKKKILGEN